MLRTIGTFLLCFWLILPTAASANTSNKSGKTLNNSSESPTFRSRRARRGRYVAQRKKKKRRKKRRKRRRRRGRKGKRKRGKTLKGKTIRSRSGCRVNWRLKVRPDWKKATVLDVVKWISKQTCQNFIVSDRIRGGSLHIISEKAVTLRMAYKAFFASLEANQMTAVRSGRFWKIIYTRDARQTSTRVYTKGKFRHPNRDEVVTYLFRLKYLDANRVRNLARQLITGSGAVIAYQPNNMLLLIDYASNLYRVTKILRSIDLPEAQTKSRIYVLRIRHAQAREVAAKLKSLFRVGRRRRSKRRRTRRRRSRKRRRRRKKSRIVRRIKTSKSSSDDSEDSYQLDKLVADDRTNQIVVLCNAQALKRVTKIIRDIDIPLPGDGQIWVHYLKFASSNELAQTLSQLTRGTRRRRYRRSRRAKKASELFEGEVKVTADKATNALVVVANRRDYESLTRVIKKLDIPRKQVFVEIVILEVSMEKSRELGVAFHKGETTEAIGGKTSVGLLGTNLGGLNSLILSPTALMGLAFGLRGSELANTSSIFGTTGTVANLPSFGVILRAIQSNTDVDIISTPHILTTANKQATLLVGQNVPFISGASIAGAGQAGIPQIRNIQRQDVALTLKIKPQVDSGDYVRLDFEQELKELAGNDPELGPTTTTRKIKTVVLARDRQTVVIGGLVREKITNGISKVPFLGDIPLIGALFRLRKKTVEKRNLLVFLTPYVIKTENDFRKIFQQKMKERKEFLRLFYSGKARKVPDQRNYKKSVGLMQLIRNRVKKGKQEAKSMEEKKLQSAKEEQKAKNKGKKKPKSKGSNPTPKSAQPKK